MKNHAPGGKGGLEAAATECLEHLLPGQKDGGIVGLSQQGARRVHKVHEDYKRVDGCPFWDLSKDHFLKLPCVVVAVKGRSSRKPVNVQTFDSSALLNTCCGFLHIIPASIYF